MRQTEDELVSMKNLSDGNSPFHFIVWVHVSGRHRLAQLNSRMNFSQLNLVYRYFLSSKNMNHRATDITLTYPV